MDRTETCAAEVPSAEVEAVRLTGNIGAEIRGIRLSGELGDDTVAAIRRALLKHKVIFFRDQHDLTAVQQETFAERLGEIAHYPNVSGMDGTRALLDLHADEGYLSTIWHTDMTFMARFPQASVLRAVTIPSVGGDTMWANTAAAYRDLPAPLKALADTLTAVHMNTSDYDERFGEFGEDRLGKFKRNLRPSQSAEHPVVSVHPETGERVLLLGQQFVRRFVGMTLEDSHRLIAILQDHISRPEHTVRWRWRVGDLAVWDNRATQHRVVPDYGDEPRNMRRVTVQGATATGLNGFVSRQLGGETQAPRAA